MKSFANVSIIPCGSSIRNVTQCKRARKKIICIYISEGPRKTPSVSFFQVSLVFGFLVFDFFFHINHLKLIESNTSIVPGTDVFYSLGVVGKEFQN